MSASERQYNNIDRKFTDARMDIIQEELSDLSNSIVEIQLAITNFETFFTIKIAEQNRAIAQLKKQGE